MRRVLHNNSLPHLFLTLRLLLEQEISDEKLAVAFRPPSLAPLDQNAVSDDDSHLSCICDIDREGGEPAKDHGGILVP